MQIRSYAIIGICVLLCSVTFHAQTAHLREGQLFLTWGYNRAYYQRSDIHFKGDGYDFTLLDARAEDMPEKFSKDYFDITQFTVPQFNFRLGYYFKGNTAVSVGWDHMKYRLITTQMVKMVGYIDEEKFPLEEFNGTFANESVLYRGTFMDYHHSDGFNFLRLALEQRLPFWNSAGGKFRAVMNGSVSAGAMMPWTDFTFFGEHHRNKPHFAGYGASISAAFRFEIAEYFFLQVGAQSGWTNLPDIMLEDHLPSRASQQIVFLERSWALGGYIPVKKVRNSSDKMLE